VSLRREAPLGGTLLRRYRRFLADVETDAGQRLTVHCPDPGSMHGCAVAGARVRCSLAANPRRRLRHTLEMIRVGRVWVGVNTARANAVVAELIARGSFAPLAGYPVVEREVRCGAGSRLDFRLRGRAGDRRDAWLEVKSVTLAEGSRALFPDSPSERARRHVEALRRLARRERALLLFLVQRADCDSVAPAEAIDPAYADALRRAARAGVEFLALGCRVDARSIAVERALPVLA
jgi:sugar fermentation stimulation protein A